MKRRSFVVRVWVSDTEEIHGQVSDPLTGWRQTFRDGGQLWTLIKTFVQTLPPNETPPENDEDSATL